MNIQTFYGKKIGKGGCWRNQRAKEKKEGKKAKHVINSLIIAEKNSKVSWEVCKNI